MSSIERLLTGLEKLRTDSALGSVAAPRDKTVYEFGRICGYDEGLGAAIELLNKILEENPDEARKNHSAFGEPLIRGRA